MRQVAEGDGRHGCVRAHGCFERLYERGKLRVDPGLVMDALQQLPARSQFPCELREDLVLLIGPRELRAGARLTVIVAEILISGEEPQSITNSRPTDVRCQVTVPVALVATLQSARARNRTPYGLAGQTGRLSIIRPVKQKFFASLPGDDVDHGALHAAELSRRPDGLDLHFLDEVDAWLRARDAAARTREIRAVDQKLILVGAGTERRHRGGGGARGRGGRDAGSGPDEVEHAHPACR